MGQRHPRRRNRRPGCLDSVHVNPDLPCPYCTAFYTDQDDILSTAHRRHTNSTTEDRDGFGWN